MKACKQLQASFFIMQIQLDQVVPVFIEEEKILASEVWNKSLLFTAGQKIQIIAPSGSGKTSLIHFLYGIRKDYTGTISYDEKDIRDFNAEKFALYRQQHISIVLQDLRLFPEHTVTQNLEIKRQLQPYHHQSKITEMAKRLGVEKKLTSLCKTCSYGEQQRVAIIRSLQQPFDFLLLDEPFSHLDESNQQKAMELIEEEVLERKAAIILADLKQISNFKADRIIYL